MTLTSVKTTTHSSKSGKNPLPSTGGSEQPPSFNLVAYLKGVRQEWHKITWPTREQVIAETGVVLVVVTLFSLFVFGVDKLFQLLIQWIT